MRYRHIDPKLVPELKNALVDLDLPVKENTNTYRVSCLKRPLIHLLLIQETMQIDTLEAVRVLLVLCPSYRLLISFI